MRAALVTRHGGPDVLDVVEMKPPVPGPGQLLVAVSAAGINFIDVYQRSGMALYAMPPPYVPGTEGVGRIVSIGDGVTGFAVDDRVVWKQAPGSYAELVAVAADEAVPVPDGISDETAVAAFAQGLTADYLTTSVNRISSGDVAVVHSAAGGVGLLLTQLIKHRGGRVVGSVSTDAKAAVALRAGADLVVGYDDVGDAVRRLTAGRGADVVYDAVGAATFDTSLSILRPRGHLVVYGASSGAVPPFDIMRLNRSGSVTLSRPSLVDFTRTRDELLERATRLFELVTSGTLSVHIGGRYPLEHLPAAYEQLEGRRSTGKLIVTIGR